MVKQEMPARQCEICGIEYTPKRRSQRYCPECGANTRRAAHKYIRAEMINRVHAGDRRPDGAMNWFIKSSYGIKIHVKRCIVCGRPLDSKTDDGSCCSEACKKKLAFRLAAGDRRYVVCKTCGEAYLRVEDETGCCPACEGQKKLSRIS